MKMKKFRILLLALLAFSVMANAQVTKSPKTVFEKVDRLVVQIAIVEDSIFYFYFKSDNQFDKPAALVLGINAEMAYNSITDIYNAAMEKESFEYNDAINKKYRFVYRKALDYYEVYSDDLAGKSSLQTKKFKKAVDIISKYYQPNQSENDTITSDQ
jgi:hypothetical protein